MAVSEHDRIGRAGLSAAAVEDYMIVLLGGHDGERPLRTCEVFVPDRNDITKAGSWSAMPAMLARRTYPVCVTAGCQAIAVGGSADGRVLNTMEVFDTESADWDMWFTMPPMQVKRTLFGAVIGDNKLIVCGGFDGIRDLTSVEMYDFGASSWHRLPNMELGRSCLALVASKDTKQVYAIGGQARNYEEGERAVKQVDILDLHSEVWLPGVPMIEGRLGHGAALLQTANGEAFIYVCGGSNGLNATNSMERFNIAKQVWEEMPPMGATRCQHGVAVIKRRLYVMGGYDGQGVLNTFECFDPETNKWGPLLPMGANEVFHLPHGHEEILEGPLQINI